MSALGTELEKLIERIVDARIEERLGALHGTSFSSADLPPATSKRLFHERCRRSEVNGARKNGRAWTCSREAWEASLSRPKLRLLERVRDNEPTVDELADLAIAKIRTGGRR